MAFVIKATQSGGAVYVGAPGLYDAQVVEVRKDHITGGNFGSGDVARFMCALDDMTGEDGEPVIIDATANLLLTPLSKLWGWLENLGIYVAVGHDVDLEQAVLKHCVVSITDNVRDGQTFSRVDGLYPPKRTSGPRPAPAEAPDLLTPTGGVNWTAFWAEAARRQINREMVASYVGGDINAIVTMPVLDVLKILEELRGV